MPYFTDFKTAHVVVPALIVSGWVENPELWVQITVELTLIVWLSLVVYREARA